MPAITYILLSMQKLNFHTIRYPGRTNTLKSVYLSSLLGQGRKNGDPV